MKQVIFKEKQKEDGENQIISQQKIVDFDVKEFTIELIISKYIMGLETDENDIFIPEYQRSFVWSEERKSKFIESVLMGLPIPYIFTADLGTGRLEMVDGTQRLRTLVDFNAGKFRLKDLEILTSLNGFQFSDLLKSRQRKFLNSTLRMITLTEKSDEDIRYLMFERINTGSDTLKDMEKRKGIFAGKFIDFVYKECATHTLFKKLTKYTDKLEKRGEPQELIIRFFAYSDRYLNVNTGVNEFLNNYTADMNKKFNKVKMFNEFERMLKFVNKYLPDGFTKTKTSQKTPRVRWDSIAVGVNLALRENPSAKPKDLSWLNSDQYKYITTHGGQNAPSAIKERIEFVKNKILLV
jgi:hypothetical protein